MEDTIDLFEQYETLPMIIQMFLKTFEDTIDEDAYDKCRLLEKQLLPHGYTFDWGLSGEPFNLRRISECNVGDWAVISGEAVADEGFKSNYGMVIGFSSDMTPNNTEPNFYAHLTLKSGESATVNAHEITKLY